MGFPKAFPKNKLRRFFARDHRLSVAAAFWNQDGGRLGFYGSARRRTWQFKWRGTGRGSLCFHTRWASSKLALELGAVWLANIR